MTSVNYNVAATTALRTLQQTNKGLEQTQNRVSTGLKIGEAKDNAAYWSISTTLKSDNKALDTVKDALNLGAATVDTAYQGLNKALEVVNDIKSKVTAASQNGVDKKALQSEIEELQKQLSAIATSSSFSGENWLSVNSSVTGYNPDKSVVSSFSRDANNNVTLSSIQIDTRSFVLVDGSSTNEGILDSGKAGNGTLTGGIAATLSTGYSPTAAATSGGFTTAALNLSGLTVADHVQFNVVIDGGAPAAIDVTLTAAGLSLTGFAAQLQTAIGATATVTADTNNNTLIFKSAATGVTSNVSINSLVYTNGVTPKTPSPATGLVTTTGTLGTAATTYSPAVATMATAFSSFTLDSNDTIKFDVNVNGVATKLRVDQATIAKALGTPAGDAGTVTTAADYAKVLTLALKNANVSGVTVGAPSTAIVFTGTTDTTALTIGTAVASKGDSILDIDVTTATTADLKAYLENISTAADLVTSGAALLGAVSSRVELQQTFVAALVDTIEKGVSGLIDADLSEESTRLQALQTKQQLGIQALSIANSSTQNVLSLFQN